jgi:hypothetical protein
LYCSTRQVGSRLEREPVLLGPPVAQVAVAVALAPLVVEPVADLVADHGADRAVVDRVVRRQVEERGLEDRRGNTISLFTAL